MSRPKLPRSVRKYLRQEKARIRATASDPVTMEERMRALVARYDAIRRGRS